MKRLILLAVILWAALPANASHIVGGEMSYECLGNNQYRITLKVYRDCQSTNNQGQTTPFDQLAAITVHRAIGGGQYSMEQNLQVPIQTQTNIAVDLSNPCLIPPTNVCVDQAVYEATVTLPFNAQGYVISYQRCCRNNTIANIGNPGGTGATYTIFLSDLAQTSCNNSPVFTKFPPIVICKGQPVDFDHSATDADGDSLVYSLCSPLTGGTTNNPAPSTAAAPPYPTVAFLNPFTSAAPLAGNPVVDIDPQTGFITGNPQFNGQFVVGVCVAEYRNGVLMSVTQRDFQFNVTDCAVSVVADVLEDSLAANGTFLINSCDDPSIQYINESRQAQFIDGYLWEFNIGGGNTFSTTAVNPQVTYPGPGTYIGQLIVNPNSADCSDTATIITNIFNNPDAGFTYAYDSCEIGPINFTSTSQSFDAPIETWLWDFGDDSSSTQVDPSYQYQDAGTFAVIHTVIDTNGCQDTYQQNITWAPAPIIDIVPSAASGCVPLEVTFENNSYPINGYNLFWTLGDGFTSGDSDPTHTYQDTGLYTVTVRIESPLGCVAVDTFVDLINVRNPPTARFYTQYDSCNYGPVAFFDNSIEGDGAIVEWIWDFQDGDSATTPSQVSYQYDSAGTYLTTLTIIDENDCVQTASREVSWFPAPVFQVGQPAYIGCEPLTVQIENTSYPINGYFTLWELGDGYYSDQASPVHTYEEPGVYSLKLSVISPTGCYDEQVFEDLVIVNPNPIADFSFAPEQPTNFNPTVTFTDFSQDADTWAWDFGNGDSSNEINPTYTFPDTGLQTITLIVTHPQGCQDTMVQVLDVAPDFTYFLPNAFTPNEDGKNDGYRGVGELFAISDFQMQIWSRWGEMVFQTQDPTEAWNGRINNTGQMVQNGVYVCVVTLTGPRGEKYEYKSFATVVR